MRGITIYVFSGHSKNSSCSSIILHGEAFFYFLLFMDRFNFYTSPEVYATIGMTPKKCWTTPAQNGIVQHTSCLCPFCLTALLQWSVVLSYDKVWDAFRWKQGIRSVFQRIQKIRTLLLSRKGSDFHCLVRVVIQHFLKTIVVQFVFEVIG